MYLYENVIIDDINKLFTNGKVRAVIADSINEGIRRIAAEKEDKITLPAIILTGGNWNIDDPNFYSLMHGSEIRRIFGTPQEESAYASNVNIIPFTPSYNMYIVASSSRECDMLTREIIFHYYMYPTLVLNIPYGLDAHHTFNLVFEKSVQRTQAGNGLVYRTLSFSIQGAYLWHNNTFNVVKKLETSVKEEIDGEI